MFARLCAVVSCHSSCVQQGVVLRWEAEGVTAAAGHGDSAIVYACAGVLVACGSPLESPAGRLVPAQLPYPALSDGDKMGRSFRARLGGGPGNPPT